MYPVRCSAQEYSELRVAEAVANQQPVWPALTGKMLSSMATGKSSGNYAIELPLIIG